MRLFVTLLTTAAALRTTAVIGGSGRLGRRVVQKLVERGDRVKCLTRSPRESTDAVEYVEGSVGDVASLTALLQGCDVCIAAFGATRRTQWRDVLPFSKAEEDPSHAKQVNYVGVRNLLQAAETAGCSRVVRVTGQNENPYSLFSILINGFGSMAKAWNYEGEALLRANRNVDYTIVRPGVMSWAAPADETYALRAQGGRMKVTKISYDAIAELLVLCGDFPNTRRATLTAMAAEKDGAASWRELLESGGGSDARARRRMTKQKSLALAVGPDTRRFPESLLAQSLLAVRVAGLLVVALFAFALKTLVVVALSFFLA